VNTARTLLPACALLLAGTRLAAAEVPFDGMTIGMPVGTAAAALGPPVAVSSENDGHRFTFAGETAVYTDDDGTILAIDARAGSPRIEVDGEVRTFAIGRYTAQRADAELAGVAEFTTPTRHSYRLGPRRDLVFEFSAPGQLLDRVTYGEPGQLVRLGLLPGDAAAKAVTYRAPQLRRSGDEPPPAAPAGSGDATVFRLTIDRGGTVSAADVLVPSSRPSDDARLAATLRTRRYTPANLDGRPISGTVFVEVRH